MRFAIVRNSARCTACGDEVQSNCVHHVAQCRCGAIAVGGGATRLRRFGASERIVDTSLFVDSDRPTRPVTAAEAGQLLARCQPAAPTETARMR